MAALTDVQTVNITINGVPLEVPKGELIVESIKRIGLDVPIFCYHPRLKPVGMCRMCLIEMGSKGPDGSVRMMPKPQTACSLPATEGLVIVTDSDRIYQDRKGVLEFLLINHPLDCPICDRGGECPLQNNTLFYGPSTSRFIEAKRHAPKAYPLSKFVTLDLERCIQCGRCVRFTEEISGDAQLAFRFRGASMQPSTFELRDFSSKFSGNTIEICPVGALTNSTYRFRARPWDLETKPAICTNCGNGCNVYLDHRNQTLVRVNGRTNELVNEEWTCDRGKFGHGFYNSDRRLGKVLKREGVRLVPTSWSEAFRLIQEAFVGKSNRGALIGGCSTSNEDIFSIASLFYSKLKTNQVSFFGGLDHPANWKRTVRPTPIAEFESTPAVLVFGSDLSVEEPILYLRIRKGVLRSGSKLIVANSYETDADGFADILLRYNEGTEAALANALTKEVASKGSNIAAEITATGLAERDVRAAAEILREAGGSIVTTHSLFDRDRSGTLIDDLLNLAKAANASFDCFSLAANGTGAEIFAQALGAGNLTSTHQILKSCAGGEVDSLWVIGEELLDYPDQSLVKEALENVEFLVVQDIMETELTAYASLVLPMTAPAETDGTWTNIEGRVQKMKAALNPREESKPLWLVATELGARVGSSEMAFGPADVFRQFAATVPAFGELSYASIPESGALVAANNS